MLNFTARKRMLLCIVDLNLSSVTCAAILVSNISCKFKLRIEYEAKRREINNIVQFAAS